MCEVDVFAENLTVIDWELHDLWIKGLNVTEAVTVMRERGILNEYSGVTQDLLVSDINDHYRLFSRLEQLLLTAGNFKEQLLYQMDPSTQHELIERYYSLDASLCRELLSFKKLSSRLRKDLDEIAEKTHVQLKSCRRQFDNIKRVFKAIEDMPGCYVPNIQKTFHLSKSLSEQYATLVFVVSFRVELNKKRLNFLTFDTIKTICLLLMDNWMEDNSTDSDEPGLDREFLVSLKELKVLLERDKEHRNIVCSRVQALPTLVSAKSYSEIESNFKMLTRNVLSVAQSLGSSKDVKDFFVNLVEKLVEPTKAMGLERGEVEEFLKAYTCAVTDNVLLVEEAVKRVLVRFMGTLGPCVLAVY